MKVLDVMNLIRERKWDSLVILLLLILISVTLPLAISSALTNGLEKGLEPTNKAMQSIDDRLRMIEKITTDEVVSRGIQAYKKVYTIADLEANTQNSASIQLALQHPDAHAILFQIDRERTLLFEDYFRDPHITEGRE